MAAPIITDLPTPTPDRSQSQSEFNTNTAAFLNALPAMVTEENALAVWSNDTAVAVQANADAAANSATMSASSANFVGSWADQTGAANIPYSVENNSIIYMLLNNLADVTLSEPVAGNADWVEISQKIRVVADETVTVGAGGDFLTINEALEYFDNRYPAYKNTGVTGEISLLAGFVMAEQVICDAINLGWVTITGIDAETTITRSSLTVDVVTMLENEYDLSPLVSYPAFSAINGGVAPKIDQQFFMDASGSQSNKEGFFAHNSPLVTFIQGIRSVPNSAVRSYSSNIIIAASCNFSGSGLYAQSRGITCYSSTITGYSSVDLSDCLDGIFGFNSSIKFGGSLDVSSSSATPVTLNYCSFEAESMNGSGSGSPAKITGGTANISSANLVGCGLIAKELASVSALSSNCQVGGSPAATDIVCETGASIAAHSATGGLSQLANATTSDGIIYQ